MVTIAVVIYMVKTRIVILGRTKQELDFQIMVNHIILQTTIILKVMPTPSTTTRIAVMVPIMHLIQPMMRIEHACRQ
jgi:hypothetical protein